MSEKKKLLIALILGVILGGFFIYFINLGKLDEKWIGVVGSLGGVLIGGLLGGLVTYLMKQEEFNNQIRKGHRERYITKLEELYKCVYDIRSYAVGLIFDKTE